MQQDRDRVSTISTMGRKRMEETRKRQNPKRTPKASFQSFGISPALLAALSGMSITTPTEIQAACIPPILAGECVDFWDSTSIEQHAKAGIALVTPKPVLGRRLRLHCPFCRSCPSTHVGYMRSYSHQLGGRFGLSVAIPLNVN